MVLEENFIKFLGTAGARFVVARQLRFSGGTLISLNNKKIILDPGPGTIVRCAKAKPPVDVTQVEAIILSHLHIDHSNDVNILIDAMTSGGIKKRGVLFAPADALNGNNQVVLNYLRSYLDEIVILKENTTYQLGDGINFSTSIKHRHPVETYGIIFHLPGRKVSFMADTKYFSELSTSYVNSDLLIMNVVFHQPVEHSSAMHLSLEDVKNVLTEIKPAKIIMTHFGTTMLKAKPWELASKLTAEYKVEVIAATDGMKVDLNLIS
ncbi:metallo-beta-lactamase [Peptococcaceae bacterium SCADC1_2_3]|jgi:ribonuclease BN (tRNA processing enzyme)|nr:metallo-beta-lactamase [Peptococcaceae bacterium SCADC1_2_3]KFI36296.1 metallo-beta-lactamase [Peptococcaceae bacterium SCADC1_2_3]